MATIHAVQLQQAPQTAASRGPPRHSNTLPLRPRQGEALIGWTPSTRQAGNLHCGRQPHQQTPCSGWQARTCADSSGWCPRERSPGGRRYTPKRAPRRHATGALRPPWHDAPEHLRHSTLRPSKPRPQRQPCVHCRGQQTPNSAPRRHATSALRPPWHGATGHLRHSTLRPSKTKTVQRRIAPWPPNVRCLPGTTQCSHSACGSVHGKFDHTWCSMAVRTVHNCTYRLIPHTRFIEHQPQNLLLLLQRVWRDCRQHLLHVRNPVLLRLDLVRHYKQVKDALRNNNPTCLRLLDATFEFALAFEDP